MGYSFTQGGGGGAGEAFGIFPRSTFIVHLIQIIYSQDQLPSPVRRPWCSNPSVEAATSAAKPAELRGPNDLSCGNAPRIGVARGQSLQPM